LHVAGAFREAKLWILEEVEERLFRAAYAIIKNGWALAAAVSGPKGRSIFYDL
jgi:hypothetical protein